MEDRNVYEICYTRAAEKFFRKHEDLRSRYEKSIAELICGEHPEEIDVKKIKGNRQNYYRIRLGSYRVIYTLINGKIVTVFTWKAGSRGDIYKKLPE